MASIKVKYRPSTTKVDEGTVYIQIIHNREVKQIKTNVRVKLSDWNFRLSQIKDPIRQNIVAEIILRIKSSIGYLEQIKKHIMFLTL